MQHTFQRQRSICSILLLIVLQAKPHEGHPRFFYNNPLFIQPQLSRPFASILPSLLANLDVQCGGWPRHAEVGTVQLHILLGCQASVLFSCCKDTLAEDPAPNPTQRPKEASTFYDSGPGNCTFDIPSAVEAAEKRCQGRTFGCGAWSDC